MSEEVKELKDVKKENKARTMRLSDENSEWWDEFVKEVKEKQGNGSLSQNDAFSLLRQAAEIGGVKAKVPGRADEVDDVRHLCDQFVQKYLAAVEGIAIAKEKAEADVKGQIDKLQSQIVTLTNEVEYWKEEFNKESKKVHDWIGKTKEFTNLIESQKERISDLRFVNDLQKETIAKKDAEIAKLEEQVKNVPDVSNVMQTIAEMRDLLKNDMNKVKRKKAKDSTDGGE